MLEIVDILANLARWRAQQAQRFGMAIEEIGMLPQIGDNLTAANVLRQDRRQSAVVLGFRLIARPVDHGAATSPCQEAGGDGRRLRKAG
jgi:hypothetical protein